MTNQEILDPILPKGSKLIPIKTIIDQIDAQYDQELAGAFWDFAFSGIIPVSSKKYLLLDFLRNRDDLISIRAFQILLESDNE